MRKLLLIALSAITLGGCANHYQDIPHPPITQEQDTPFVFKERYQVTSTELTVARIETQNDFVTIEETDQIVFWHPSIVTTLIIVMLN